MKKLFIKPVSRTLIRYVDFLSARINSYNLKDTIVISGTPRGGTTWLMEILETLPRYKSIFEPLHKVWYPEVKNFELPPMPYLLSKEEDSEGDILPAMNGGASHEGEGWQNPFNVV